MEFSSEGPSIEHVGINSQRGGKIGNTGCFLNYIISTCIASKIGKMSDALMTSLTRAGLDRLVEPLRATCTTKVKANSVKQEFEKQDELKRSAMRAVAALLAVPDAGT